MGATADIRRSATAGVRRRQVEEQGDVRAAGTGGHYIDLIDDRHRNPAPEALVGAGRVGEAVAEHVPAARQLGLNSFDQMLAPAGKNEQQLDRAVDPAPLPVEEDLANRLRERGAPGFMRHHVWQIPRREPGRRGAQLGRLAAAVETFEGEETGHGGEISMMPGSGRLKRMHSIASPLLWTTFLSICGILLVLDLAVLNRGSKVISARAAIRNTLFFVSMGALFAVYLGWEFGSAPALEFVTGYLIEYALSVDNLFVFLVIFTYFSVPAEHQHRVLFWGILGAILLRGVFIVAGAALLAKFAWMIFVFGAFLVYTGVKLLFTSGESIDPARNPLLQLCQRFLPATSEYHGERFFARVAGKLVVTPLFLVLVVVDVIDVVFAVDSIPAIFAVTRDPFVVFSSNIFAVLGLRSLYFLLADLMGRFHYLKYGLGLVLAFVGLKMLISDYWHMPIGLSLGVILALLAGAVLASWLFPPKAAPSPGEDHQQRDA